jgi:thiamine biosynthesis lipoprotein
VAKGYAVDRAVGALQSAGVKSGVVNAGGDLRAFGRRDERVWVRDPRSPGKLLPLTEIRNGAACTSAPYFSERSSDGLAGRQSDLWAGTSSKSILGPVSVTVMAPTAIWADALTKVVLVQREAADSILTRYAAEAWFLA